MARLDAGRNPRRAHSRTTVSMVTLVAALALAGCTKVGPEFVKPDATVAPEWNELEGDKIKPGEADHASWWKVFNDPVLDQLIENGYANNLDLQIAGLRVLESRAQLGIAVGTMYPQQQAGVAGAQWNSLSRSNANSSIGDLSYSSFDFGIDAAWELDFWGKFRRGVESADADVLSNIANYDNVLVSLTAEIANAYVVIRTFEERLKVARANVEIQERSLRIADVRFRNGATTELDVRQAESLLRGTQATIPAFETGLRQAQNALSILLGMPPGNVRALLGEPGAIPTPPAAVAAGIPADLLRRRPDVRSAELLTASQSALIGVAQADLYPSFSLFGSLGFAAAGQVSSSSTRSGAAGFGALFSGNAFQFVGGPSVSWNIFNYGRIKNNVRVQDARLQELITNYQNTVLRAAAEVEDAMVGFVKTQEQVGFLDTGVRSASRSVDLAVIQYRDGATDYTRVLNTQEFLVDQQDLLITSRGDVVRNLVAMYKALGGGWQLRAGNDFVPEKTRKVMSDRTDWGELLMPAALENIPEPGAPDEMFPKPDW